MRTISLRGLSRDAPTLTDEVLVTHDSVVIGRFVPSTVASKPYVQVTTEHRPIDAPRGPEEPWVVSDIKATGQTTVSGTLAKDNVNTMAGSSFGMSRPAPKPARKK